MMDPRSAMAAAAMELVGVPFRLHGRDRRRGVDCVGVLVIALAAAGRRPRLPLEYTLRRTSIGDFVAAAADVGLCPADGDLTAGDLLVAKPGAAQFHAGICGFDNSIVHAHAGLGRVVLTPAPLPWPLEHHWRLTSS
jgi:cell wall-associated NlpC family hydrolase